MRSRETARRLLPAALLAGCLLVPFPVVAETRLDSRLKTCLAHLEEAGPEKQLPCLRKLKAAGPAASVAIRPLSGLLARSDGATDDLVIASALDVLRSLRTNAAPAAETLSGILPHRSKLYHERDKFLVVRLRAYIVVTLSEIGFPSSALPVLLDTLAHLDERMSPVEVGATARAVGSLGPRGHELAPYLLDMLDQRISPEEFSLERYEPRFPPDEATTVQLEAVRSLGRVCSAEDQDVVTALRQLAEKGSLEGLNGLDDRDPRLRREARRALDLILSTHDGAKEHRGERP
jgi:hypothetical protein